MKLHFISILISFSVFSLSVKSQNIQSEKKLIVGTWVSTEGDWNFIFENDSICKEYLVKKLEGKYLYKITSAIRVKKKLRASEGNEQEFAPLYYVFLVG